MELLFLIIFFAVVIALHYFLENIFWIGLIGIGLIVLSIVRQIVQIIRGVKDHIPYSMNFGEVFLFLLKIAGIGGLVYLMNL